MSEANSKPTLDELRAAAKLRAGNPARMDGNKTLFSQAWLTRLGKHFPDELLETLTTTRVEPPQDHLDLGHYDFIITDQGVQYHIHGYYTVNYHPDGSTSREFVLTPWRAELPELLDDFGAPVGTQFDISKTYRPNQWSDMIVTIMTKILLLLSTPKDD